jgi:uncharacterized protein YcaQ
VLGAYAEAHAAPGDVAPPLARELRTMAGWLVLDDVAVEHRGNLARALTAELRR